MTKSETTNLLRAFVRVLEQVSDAEYEQLLNGSGQLTFAGSQARIGKTPRAANKGSKVSAEELQVLILRLQATKSREEARDLIQRDPRVPLKENLEQLARLLQVHVNKQDRRDALEDKVIESVIGVRLRSEAILGLDFKS